MAVVAVVSVSCCLLIWQGYPRYLKIAPLVD